MGKRERANSNEVEDVSSVSPFKSIKSEATFSLTPAYVGRAQQGIHELLNSRILEYDAGLGGVMLSYSDIKLVEGNGLVFTDEPEIQYRASFTALLFVAKPGMVLDGQVSLVSAGHIQLLFAGAFQVTILADKLDSRYRFMASNNKFVSKKNVSDELSAGVTARFCVERMQVEDSAFHLEASMSGSKLGAVNALSSKKSKKHKKSKE
mmetsp:Transcript_20382/g.36253  ORF Transcript_20382/g.36253 Transcript_20382/m.36253 type:complete len:207 (-) Transcript_20382:196-816(-)|eukprot:CAMPEP_0184542442 /NCGR_PEP_ID=MMETSP0199_2-20130426/2049_1 /TAXON_ID=1112570 /ORGANISM="Thraustochytrium sp., Strain LLF1b" /LENGTH=206 /DNA_ID=CAMNT_0026936245 /DNA_START=130 /DNA_END=750 /DNA_ORIENTATION=+